MINPIRLFRLRNNTSFFRNLALIQASVLTFTVMLIVISSVVIGSRAAIATPVTAVPVTAGYYSSSPEHHLEWFREDDRLLSEAPEVQSQEVSDQQNSSNPSSLPPKKPVELPITPEDADDGLTTHNDEVEDDEVEALDEGESLDSAPELSEPEPTTKSGKDEPEPSSDVAEPVKTYFLNLISDNPRQQIKLDPQATQIKVSVSGGANSVRCSDGVQTYTCVSGKPLTITHDKTNPITEFWAQNSGGGTARIRIDVYQ